MSARAKVDIIRRRVNIPYDDANAPGWIPAEADIENVLNAISFVFPPGEKFFLKTVQHYHDRITDPVLKEQVKAFVFQEAMHSKEHARANEKLALSFPQGPEIEKAIAHALDTISRHAPYSTQLAITCALEHFTAILSHELLKWQEGFINKSDPAFAAMWLWHAVEEAEHKAVCFDVYQQVAGKGVISYLNRVGAMLYATWIFAIGAHRAVRMLRQGEKDARKEGASTADAPAGNAAPDKPKRGTLQVLREIVPLRMYLQYFRPGFHPWDIDDSDLIAEWKGRYKDFNAIVNVSGEAHA
jgi:predicted metal-dependent hydrolase